MNLITSTYIDFKGSSQESRSPKDFKPKYVVKKKILDPNNDQLLKIPLHMNLTDSLNPFYMTPKDRISASPNDRISSQNLASPQDFSSPHTQRSPMGRFSLMPMNSGGAQTDRKLNMETTPINNGFNNKFLESPKDNEQYDQKNIFAVSNFASAGGLNDGIRMDENGDIVKYSILGKPEWFIKMHHNIKPKLSFVGSQKRFEVSPSNTYLREFENNLSTELQSAKKKPADENSKIKVRTMRVTKNELIQQYENFKKREEENEKNEQDNLKKYKLAHRLQITKDERNLKSFDVRKEGWENILKRTLKQCSKKPEESVIVQA
jgi:hypothetical protein